MTDYKKPDVWTWTDANENISGNRPTAGARFEQSLPSGSAPHQLYSLGTPNGIKVVIMLEELKALGVDANYDLFLIKISEGDQFGSDFVKINPNSKIPALIDNSYDQPLRVFESGNIVLHLADKFNHFIPQDLFGRTEVLNWVFWQMGAAPFLGGGFGHFYHYAPVELEYPINRYAMEAKRQLHVLDQLLAERPYIAGQEYTIADMMIWPWYGRLVEGHLYGKANEFLSTHEYQHLARWAEKIAERPAVQKALNAHYQPTH